MQEVRSPANTTTVDGVNEVERRMTAAQQRSYPPVAKPLPAIRTERRRGLPIGALVAASYTRTVLSANAVTTKSIRPHLESLRFGDISVHGLS